MDGNQVQNRNVRQCGLKFASNDAELVLKTVRIAFFKAGPLMIAIICMIGTKYACNYRKRSFARFVQKL